MNARRILRVALYVRVSTDHQTVENQEHELRAAAALHGWEIAHVYRDAGMSGRRADNAEGWTSF